MSFNLKSIEYEPRYKNKGDIDCGYHIFQHRERLVYIVWCWGQGPTPENQFNNIGTGNTYFGWLCHDLVKRDFFLNPKDIINCESKWIKNLDKFSHESLEDARENAIVWLNTIALEA